MPAQGLVQLGNSAFTKLFLGDVTCAFLGQLTCRNSLVSPSFILLFPALL